MVIIALPSPLVSVILSVINCFAEFSLLSSAKALNSVFELFQLRRRNLLRIKSHVRRITILEFLFLLLFIVLEVLVSFYSFPARSTRNGTAPCVSVRTSIGTGSEKVKSPTTQAQHIMISCSHIEGDSIFFRLGNYSLSSENKPVNCSDTPAFKFKTNGEDKRLMKTNGSKISCVFRENEEHCFAAKKEENILWLTHSTYKSSLEQDEQYFFATEVFFPIDEDLELLSRRRADIWWDETVYFRIEVLLDFVEGACVFRYPGKQATEIATPIAVILLGVWTFSLASLIVSSPTVFCGFYRVSDISHLAARTTRLSNDELYPIPDPVIHIRRVGELPEQFVMTNLRNLSSLRDSDNDSINEE
eukprot:gb/GEZJ01003623.1/.p1 GENE.gb/GEZJ01003623.1/~~gb/GEZJ01003623.1/.p1  ORF type:complete len:360 (-),score=33.89 gb/GEZJ01003623.1/:739-1818(-)